MILTKKDFINKIILETRIANKIKQLLKTSNILDITKKYGGIKNLKKIFKDDPEFSEILDKLTGVVDFEYHDSIKDPRFVVFPIKYEIIGIKKNIWGTHSWPELNLIYDDSKLTSDEKKKLMTILAVIINDNTVGKIETNLLETRNSGYFDVKQINGKDVDLHEDEFPFSKEDVIKIHDKLYGPNQRINENKLSPFLMRRIDLHKFEKILKTGVPYIFYESQNLEEFKYKLIKATLENYIYYKYQENIEEMDNNQVDNFIEELIQIFDQFLKHLYTNFKNFKR
jgi:hypothetical protein